MSDIIHLLPDSVANQIAAGEVVQRPSSVIKELVENSIDAGATQVQVIVEDAGKSLVQVIDNGKGMSETDARLAFERHATSKISEAKDLFALRTMGFRGEALASIAAVAQVELRTRAADKDLGVSIIIEGSRVVDQQPVNCPVGANFAVKNLFFNIPARRKFLKSNQTELSNILTEFERIALAHPETSFSLHSGGAAMMNLPAGNFKQRILGVFGKRLEAKLIPVEVKTTLINISGFVGVPSASRRKNAQQFFFVNGRYMRHPYFAKAVQTAYERLIPDGEQVPFFLNLEVAPEKIDVNIHPTKTEIKFENEQAIWQILSAAVRESIGVFNDVPSIDFDTEDRPDIPVFTQHAPQVEAPRVNYNPHYNPFTPDTSSPSSSVPCDWQQLYADTPSADASEGEDFFAAKPVSNANISDDRSPVHYQYKGRYIMTAVKSGLMIIDQCRAHYRILFEKYLLQMQNKKGDAQRVVFPEVLQLTPDDAAMLQEVMPELVDMGFELTDLGANSYAVNSIPADVEGISVTALITDMLAAAREKGSGIKDDINHRLASSMARHAAIPQGQVLSNVEMENIVNQLFACSNVNYSPDGKNILCILKQQEIEKLLG